MTSKMATIGIKSSISSFRSIWVRNIILVATSRVFGSRDRFSMLKFISDVSVTCLQNDGQDGRQSIKSPISSLIYGLEL